MTLAQLGEDVIALLDHLNIAKAWFCGISMGGLTGLWLGRFAPERFQGLVVANTAARIGDQAGWLSRARTVRQEGMAVVAAGAADRWFTHAFRQKTPEVVEALCHQLTHIDAEGYAACCEALAAGGFAFIEYRSAGGVQLGAAGFCSGGKAWTINSGISGEWRSGGRCSAMLTSIRRCKS